MWMFTVVEAAVSFSISASWFDYVLFMNLFDERIFNVFDEFVHIEDKDGLVSYLQTIKLKTCVFVYKEVY
jgi:hypothetical protein